MKRTDCLRCLAVGVGVASCAFPAAATTRYVNNSCQSEGTGLSPACEDQVNGPKLTIQAAIDVSSSGDTVVVAGGTYQGDGNHNLSFQGAPDISLECADAPGCIVDCEAQEDCGFAWLGTDNGPNVIIDGFTITRGTGYHWDQYTKGGGILCDEGSSPVIRNCVVKENVAYYTVAASPSSAARTPSSRTALSGTTRARSAEGSRSSRELRLTFTAE